MPQHFLWGAGQTLPSEITWSTADRTKGFQPLDSGIIGRLVCGMGVSESRPVHPPEDYRNLKS